MKAALIGCLHRANARKRQRNLPREPAVEAELARRGTLLLQGVQSIRRFRELIGRNAEELAIWPLKTASGDLIDRLASGGGDRGSREMAKFKNHPREGKVRRGVEMACRKSRRAGADLTCFQHCDALPSSLQMSGRGQT